MWCPLWITVFKVPLATLFHLLFIPTHFFFSFFLCLPPLISAFYFFSPCKKCIMGIFQHSLRIFFFRRAIFQLNFPSSFQYIHLQFYIFLVYFSRPFPSLENIKPFTFFYFPLIFFQYFSITSFPLICPRFLSRLISTISQTTFFTASARHVKITDTP